MFRHFVYFCLSYMIFSPFIAHTVHTVKASNFGPHGNFGPFLASSVFFPNEFCTKNEQNRIYKSIVFLLLSFSSNFRRTRFDDSKPF
jgi:hypothetical protein